MEKNSTREILTIDHPMMIEIKDRLNDAIMLALVAAKDSATATVTLKMDIETQDDICELDLDEKHIDPISFTCTVSTKKKVFDKKGVTMSMVANKNDDGLFEVDTLNDQIGLGELVENGITSITVEVKRNDD